MMNHEAAAQAAQKRLAESLNRSAGQHRANAREVCTMLFRGLDAAHERAIRGSREALRAAVASLERA